MLYTTGVAGVVEVTHSEGLLGATGDEGGGEAEGDRETPLRGKPQLPVVVNSDGWIWNWNWTYYVQTT